MLTKEKIYETTAMDIYEVLAEGVLCMSSYDSGMDMDPEEGNM